MGLIGIFGYLGYLDIQKSNTNLNSIIYEIGKNNDKIKLLQIIGLILDIIDYILIRSEKAAPELLHEYYLEHTVLVKVIYYFGRKRLSPSFYCSSGYFVIIFEGMMRSIITKSSNV